METERYKKIINEYRREVDRLNTLITSLQDSDDKIYIFNPIENSDGLYNGMASEPEKLQFVMDELESRDQRVLVYLDDQRNSKEIIKKYKKFISKKRYRNIKVTDDFYSIPQDKRVRVLHSGFANNAITSGYLADKLEQGQKIILYETPDLPLTPLFDQINIETIRKSQKQAPSKSKRCIEFLQMLITPP